MLESHLRATMDRVDELNQEAIKFNRFQQQVLRQQQDKHRMLAKRVGVLTLKLVVRSQLLADQSDTLGSIDYRGSVYV